MSSNIKIYGIKNCDTVKKALKYLSSNDIAYEFIDLESIQFQKMNFKI